MSLDPFNKKILLAKLEQLQPRARAAFAAAIATRMIPTYELAASGEKVLLHTALNCAWDFIEARECTVVDCQNQLDIVMQMLHRESEKAGKFGLYVEDPIAAVAYTLRSIVSGNLEEPAWAAQRMFETVARFIEAKEKFPLKGPELVREIIKQPLMQAEFARQFEDLDELSHWSPEAGLMIHKKAEENPALPNELV